MNSMSSTQHDRDGTEKMASSAPSPLSERPAYRFLRLLAFVERTVLARHLELMTSSATLTLDVIGQRLQLGARTGNHYAIDETLKREEKKAHRVMRRRAASVPRQSDVLIASRPALNRCAARSLLSICTEPLMRTSVAAAQAPRIRAAVSFSATDLYKAASDQSAEGQAGTVSEFFHAVRDQMEEAWLINSEGWILAHPQEKERLETFASITRSAAQLGAWNQMLVDSRSPSIAYSTHQAQESIWCIATDPHHQAMLRCSPLQWATTLNAWEMYADATSRTDS